MLNVLLVKSGYFEYFKVCLNYTPIVSSTISCVVMQSYDAFSEKLKKRKMIEIIWCVQTFDCKCTFITG